MKKIFQKAIASITLCSFSTLSLVPQKAAAGELGSARDMMTNYAFVVREARGVGSLELFSRLAEKDNYSVADYREIHEVLDQTHRASAGRWVSAVSLNAQTYELSAGNFRAQVRFSSEDTNVVQINGQSFVLNPSKTLRENAEVISEVLVAQENRGLKFVSFLDHVQDLFVPKARAISGWTIAAGVFAVVGIVMAIVGLNKKKKSEKNTASNGNKGSATKAERDAMHKRYIASRQVHDLCKKGRCNEAPKVEGHSSGGEAAAVASSESASSTEEVVVE